MHRDTTAVIISFNGGSHTCECALSLTGQVDRIVVIDNGSDEASRKTLATSANENGWEVVWLGENLGIAAALNIGLEVAIRNQSLWMLTMDQDSVAAPDMLAAFGRALEGLPTAASLAPAIAGINPKEKGGRLRYAITSGNLVRVDAATVAGRYREDLFIDGVDLDFSLRLADAGYPIYSAPGAHLLHRLGERTSRFPFHTYHSPLRRYYIFRNYWVLMAAHMVRHPAFAARLSVAHLLQLGTIVLLGDQRWRSLQAIARGCVDAMLGRLGPSKV